MKRVRPSQYRDLVTLGRMGLRLDGNAVFPSAGHFGDAKTVEADIKAQNGATDMLRKALKQLIADEHDGKSVDMRDGSVNRRSVRKTIDEIGQTVG